tara:strand:- start:4828 stop:5019 length:192 start_codon:yes stop_codon:yes gene_type:complete
MEIKTGSVPLAALALIFAILQFWWIGMTIKNGREAEKLVKERRSKRIDDQKKFLEKILNKKDF